MDQNGRLAVFQAQVENVRSLKTAMLQVRRSVNAALRSNDQITVDAFTKVYALLFCAWAEANFSKVIHTPYGFDLDEIAQVKTVKEGGIAFAWEKCVQLGLRHLDAKRGSFTPNALLKLKAAINAHVFDPSLLRNKLAHGQWVIALNRPNDAVQEEFTARIKELDVVKIGAWITGHELLANLVEQLIESPKKAFMRDWFKYVVDLEQHMIEAERQTLGEHVAKLLAKDKNTGAKEKRRGAQI